MYDNSIIALGCSCFRNGVCFLNVLYKEKKTSFGKVGLASLQTKNGLSN